MSQVWPGFHLWSMLGNRSFVSCVRVLNNKSEAVKESYLRCCRMKFILLLAVVIFCTCLVINRCSYCPLLLRRYNLIHSFIHSFITWIYTAPLQGYYSEALPIIAWLKRTVSRLE